MLRGGCDVVKHWLRSQQQCNSTSMVSVADVVSSIDTKLLSAHELKGVLTWPNTRRSHVIILFDTIVHHDAINLHSK